MKPMTAERRAEIEKLLNDFYPAEYDADVIIQELLDDSAYWRETVRNAKFESVSGYEDCHYALCAFCGEEQYEPHKPDCPWLLAKKAD